MLSAFISACTPPPTSAYIHLPFCAQRCKYCAFPVVISGRQSLPSPDVPPPHPTHISYISLLIREIIAVSKTHSPKSPLKTLYLGGGTPSLLHPTLLSHLLQTIHTHLPLSPTAEITCEMDPATFTTSTAHAYRSLGINRASVGAQSFHDPLLASCGRFHTSSDIPSAISDLLTAGFDDISLDLISGLPGQTMAMWKDSLKRALDLNPHHISAYDLTLEPGTPFGNAYVPGVAPLPAEGTAADMMRVTADILGARGFEHYEVSNYASAAGKRSRHNMAYWRNQPFYGFGMGATSLVNGFRFARPRAMGGYTRYVESLEREDLSVEGLYPNVRRMSERERLEDYYINAFRMLLEGVDVKGLRKSFGDLAAERFLNAVEKNGQFVENGCLIVESDSDGTSLRVRLSERGAIVENDVLSTLLWDALWRFDENKHGRSTT